MERFWLKHYPAGVPADIDPNQYRSVVALIDEALEKYKDRNAYVGFGKAVRYARIDEWSRSVAAWMQGRGLVKGDRVAVMMPNLIQYPAVLAGILRAGLVVVNVNPLYTPRELEHQLKDSGARAIVVVENFAATLAEVIARTEVRHVVITSMGEVLGLKGTVIDFVVRHIKRMVPGFDLPGAVRLRDVLRDGARLQLQPIDVNGDDIAFLQYTGGTTGVAKGATLLHRNIVANVLQSEAWMQPALFNPKKPPPPPQMVFACALPLYHIFALTVCCLLGMRTGSLVVLIPNPRDQDALIREIKPYRITMFPAVNTLYNALANNPAFAALDFSELRVSNGGGMAVQAAVAKRWLEVTGCPVCEGYGLSETSPSATCNPTDTDVFSGTIGLPMPSTEIAILDDDGRPVPIGERGEIAIRGPQVMAGYWQRPDETAKVMTHDGFFKSGDIGVMDARGYTTIVDRKKDMIISGGFNVYPNEVEEVIAACPGVLECAVIGVPDPHSGEAVKVFVTRKDPALTEQDVITYAARYLTGYKRPKHVEFRDELPKTNVGKILRRELRDAELKKRV